MKIKLILMSLLAAIAIGGCTSEIASSIGGPLAGAAIEHNNEHYSGQN